MRSTIYLGMATVLAAIMGCSPGAEPARRAAPETSAGSAGCLPDRLKPWGAAGRSSEQQGAATGVELWGLLFAKLPVRHGVDVKIVWRVTGSGPMRISATHVDGTPARQTFVQEHDGSNWQKPGDEWGTGFVFPKAGCWELRLTRDSGSGHAWLRVS